MQEKSNEMTTALS